MWGSRESKDSRDSAECTLAGLLVDARSTGGEPFAFLSRRRWLRLALGAGGVALSGAGGLWLLRGRAPAVEGLRVLSAHQYRTLDAIARTVLPAGGVFETGAAELDLARAFDGYLADEPAFVVGDLSSALSLVEFGPLLFDGKPRTFSRCTPEERLAHWQAWRSSALLLRRQVTIAFQKFLCLVFYDDPRVWPSIGYPGPSLEALQR